MPQHLWSHAVLANLSASYPPIEGRLPTCYSPVRHSYLPRRALLVRLACIRRAVSVRSEPESNSPIKIEKFIFNALVALHTKKACKVSTLN